MKRLAAILALSTAAFLAAGCMPPRESEIGKDGDHVTVALGNWTVPEDHSTVPPGPRRLELPARNEQLVRAREEWIQRRTIAAAAREGRVNIHDAGATGKKEDLATKAVQRAIDAVHEAGGGTVYFPPGDYTTATLELKDNVTVYLEAGATLFASQNPADYTPIKTQELGTRTYEVLVYANGAKNIRICGPGTIDGQATYELIVPPFEDSFIQEEIEIARAAGVDMRRHFKCDPHVFLVFLVDCENVAVTDVTLRHSPVWSLHVQWCDTVFIRGVQIYSDLVKAANCDGIDIDGSKDVVISDCIVETADDAICLKSTLVEGRAETCENVVVSNCKLVSSSTGLKIGTESHADIRHVLFNDCVIRNSNRGMSVVMRDGGTASDVIFSDITFEGRRKHYHWWGDGDAIYVALLKRRPDSRLGRIENLVFENILADCEGTSEIVGYHAGDVRGMSDAVKAGSDGDRQETRSAITETPTEGRAGDDLSRRPLKNIRLANIRLKMRPESQPDKRATDALLIRDVDGLTIDGLEIDWTRDKTEPKWAHALHLQRCEDFELSRIKARPGLPDSERPAVQLADCADGAIHDCRATGGERFLAIGRQGTNRFAVPGETPECIRLYDNDVTQTRRGALGSAKGREATLRSKDASDTTAEDGKPASQAEVGRPRSEPVE